MKVLHQHLPVFSLVYFKKHVSWYASERVLSGGNTSSRPGQAMQRDLPHTNQQTHTRKMGLKKYKLPTLLQEDSQS